MGIASCLGGASGAGTPMSTSTPKFHIVPRVSPVSRRLHCSPGDFLRTYLHLSKTAFVPTACSSDRASPPAATDPSVWALGFPGNERDH